MYHIIDKLNIEPIFLCHTHSVLVCMLFVSCSPYDCQVEYIDITAWLASAYDFYNKNRTNEPTMQSFVCAIHVEAILALEPVKGKQCRTPKTDSYSFFLGYLA